MIENEIKTKGVLIAPAALDSAILEHTRAQVDRPIFTLDNPLTRWLAGYVPFTGVWSITLALIEGKRVRVLPVVPGLVPFMPSYTIGGSK